MNLNNIINSIDNTLEKNIKSYNNSFIDNFIDKLKEHLSKNSATPLLILDRYEGDYAVCENKLTGKMLNIPRLKVSPYAKDGDTLKFENGKYQIYRSTQNNLL